jgi:hypothetical protein
MRVEIWEHTVIEATIVNDTDSAAMELTKGFPQGQHALELSGSATWDYCSR